MLGSSSYESVELPHVRRCGAPGLDANGVRSVAVVCTPDSTVGVESAMRAVVATARAAVASGADVEAYVAAEVFVAVSSMKVVVRCHLCCRVRDESR